MQIKRNKLDVLFSQCVREAANWTCERCGKYHPEGARQSLHCSHLYGRRRVSVRWEPLNASAHCFSCHQYLGEHPMIFADWIRANRTAEEVEILNQRAHTIIRLKDYHKREILENLKAALYMMQAERMGGETCKLTFESPYPAELLGVEND